MDDEELFSIINAKRGGRKFMVTPLKKTALHELISKPV